jgi:hypothetical protein
VRRKKRCPLYPNSDRESGFPQEVVSALPPIVLQKSENAG